MNIGINTAILNSGRKNDDIIYKIQCFLFVYALRYMYAGLNFWPSVFVALMKVRSSKNCFENKNILVQSTVMKAMIVTNRSKVPKIIPLGL